MISIMSSKKAKTMAVNRIAAVLLSMVVVPEYEGCHEEYEQ
jgi:hypothetical protein